MSSRGEHKWLRWAHLKEAEDPPRGWTIAAFDKLADVVAGQSPPSDSYNTSAVGMPFLQGNAEFSVHHPKPTVWCSAPAKRAKAGDTLISVRAPVGEVNRADRDYAIGRGLAAVRAKQSLDPDFLYHGLQRWRSCLQRVAQGTTFDAVTAKHFSQLHIAVPGDLGEQAAIAEILNAADEAIYASQIATDGARALQTSLLGEAFAHLGTEPRRLGEFATDVRYGTSMAASARGWGLPTLGIPNVVRDDVAFDDHAYSDLKPADQERLALRDGDLLLVRTNGNPHYVGRSAVFHPPDSRRWVFASYLIRVRLKDGLLPDYANLFLGLDRGRRELLRRVTTSAGNHNINARSIRLIAIPVPSSKDLQERIVQLGHTSRANVFALQRKTGALLKLREALMNDLLTGQVRSRRYDIAGHD